jgi:hypothetical protein
MMETGRVRDGIAAGSRAFEPGDGHVYTTTDPDVVCNPTPIRTYAQTTIAIVD